MELVTLSVLLVVAVLIVTLRLDQRTIMSLKSENKVLSLGATPPISIIKPVYGSDSHTEANFRSWSEQSYAGPVQLIFSFQRLDDPAISIAKKIESPHEIQVVVNPLIPGYSGKMSNLENGLNEAKHDLLVFSDSDIFAYPGTLAAIAELHESGVGLVSCLMRHRAYGNVWSRIFASFWNFEHMAFIGPSILNLGRDATGGTMSMTKETLQRLGGLGEFKDYVAEDVAIGRKAHQLGIQVGLGPIVDSPVDDMTSRQLLDKFARAALFSLSMNDIREAVQYALLFSYLLVLPIGIITESLVVITAGVLMAATRLIGSSRFWSHVEGKHRIFFEIYLSDIIFLFAYVRAVITREMFWGGHKYSVGKDGRMTRISDDG